MKRIVIRAFGDEKWIGGLYYTRNITYQLMQNPYLVKRIVVFVNKNNKNFFDFIDGRVKVVICKGKTKRNNDFELLKYIVSHRGTYVFPAPRLEKMPNIVKRILNMVSVFWIPDFQDSHYPHFFDAKQLQERHHEFVFKAESEFPLILSSENSLSDFRKYYSNYKKNVYVMPFVSYIEDYLNEALKNEKSILNKYNLLSVRYACIMNQFWQHKNHTVVFEAIKMYVQKCPQSDLKFVFTGQLLDKRNPDYIEKIKSMFDDPIISPHIKMLGFTERTEQICIMNNSDFVIQPSLFEGWGTVVEDAKVLDKTILLSDIPVHHEQMNKKCRLFNPYDSYALSKLILEECEIEHHDDIRTGIDDAHRRARIYSKSFERLIKDIEKGK